MGRYDTSDYVLWFVCALFVVMLCLPIWLGWRNTRPHTLTCYNNVFDVTYMSPSDQEVYRSPTDYGVWRFKKGGSYIQNSGDTCIPEPIK